MDQKLLGKDACNFPSSQNKYIIILKNTKKGKENIEIKVVSPLSCLVLRRLSDVSMFLVFSYLLRKSGFDLNLSSDFKCYGCQKVDHFPYV